MEKQALPDYNLILFDWLTVTTKIWSENDIINTVQRPYIDSLDPADTILSSGADISGGIGPVLTVTMKNPIVLQVLVLSLTFALTAYVLYGKR